MTPKTHDSALATWKATRDMGLIVVPDAKNGIDLCGEFQYPVNARKIKEAGFDYAYVQSSRYSGQRAANFDKLVDELRGAGLSTGAYHFCSVGSDPKEQAGFFFMASGGLGKLPGELPPLADWEHCTPSLYKNHPQHCVSWIVAFMKESTRLWYGDNPSRFSSLYTYPDYCSRHQPSLSAEVGLGEYPLCWASYRQDGSVPVSAKAAPSHSIPAPFSRWSLCQYSGNNGKPVPGVPGACDRQVFHGSSAEWADFIGLRRDVSQISHDVKEDVYGG